MLPILLTAASSKALKGSYPENYMLSFANAPMFVEKPTTTDEFDLNNKVGIVTTLARIFTYSSVREHEYFKSTIVISDAQFKNNFAFGTKSAVPGFGGAVFMSYSTLFVERTNQFISNKAEGGGAICSLFGNLYINQGSDQEFESNTAFKSGGAIYFQGIYEKNEKGLIASDRAYLEVKQDASSYNFMFKSNTAGDLGGAICIVRTKVVSINNVMFSENTAGLSGGAIASLNTVLLVTKCHFQKNSVGNSNEFINKGPAHKIEARPIFTARGGGAIFFSCDQFSEGYKLGNGTRILSTESCCFDGNVANHATDFHGSPGANIMLDGFVQWSSYEDISTQNPGSLGKSSRNGFDPIFSVVNPLKTSQNCNPQLVPTNPSDPTFLTPGRVAQDNSAKNIPSPSIYTYQATQQFIPYATTSSWHSFDARTPVQNIPSIPTMRSTSPSSSDSKPQTPSSSDSKPQTPSSSDSNSQTSSSSDSNTQTSSSVTVSIPTATTKPIPYVPPTIKEGDKTSVVSTMTWLEKTISTTTLVQVEDNGTSTWVPSDTVTQSLYETNTEIVFIEIIEGSVEGGETISKQDLTLIAVGSGVGVAVLIIVIVLVLYFAVCKKSKGVGEDTSLSGDYSESLDSHRGVEVEPCNMDFEVPETDVPASDVPPAMPADVPPQVHEPASVPPQVHEPASVPPQVREPSHPPVQAPEQVNVTVVQQQQPSATVEVYNPNDVHEPENPLETPRTEPVMLLSDSDENSV